MSLRKLLSQLQFLLTVTIVSLIVVICGSSIIKPTFPTISSQSTTEPSPSLVSPIKNYNSSLVSTHPNSSFSVVNAPITLIDKPTIASINPSINKQEDVFSQFAYGHLPYQQADPLQMMLIASYAMGQYQRFEYLDPEAGKALMKLIYAARDEGVWIVPVSGFRTIEQQQKLFQAQIKRRGSVEAAAKLSAPPRYSEHHTGFAIDLADGSFPQQDVTYQFENTNAYRWLNTHAKEFGFEMSFPPNNSQGISYEPWHWRYIGSPRAALIFAIARSLNSNQAMKSGK